MDRPDDLRALVDGLTCTVCDEPIPGDGVRLLARRDDLYFLQLDCSSCASTTLGFVMTDAGHDGPLERADRLQPDAAPISADDLLDMHQLLAGWTGDVATLVREAPASDRAAGGDRRRGGSRGAGLAR